MHTKRAVLVWREIAFIRYSWKNKFLSIQVSIHISRYTSCICLQYLFPPPGSAQPVCRCCLCKTYRAAEPDPWPELWYCTSANIINKQQVAQGEKLLQSNRPGGVLRWNKHKLIRTHFSCTGRKDKLFAFHWPFLTQNLLSRT